MAGTLNSNGNGNSAAIALVWRLRSKRIMALLLFGCSIGSSPLKAAHMPCRRAWQRLIRIVVTRGGLAFVWKGEKSHSPTNAALQQTDRSEEHTSELQSLMRISYAVFCL